MSLSFGHNPLLLIVALLVAAGLSFWVYRRTVPPVSLGLRALLFSLRWLALTLILFLLFAPLLRLLDEVEQPPILAVLVDNSQSLGLRDDGTSEGAFDLGAAVRATLGQIDIEALPAELAIYHFDSQVEAQREGTAGFDSLAFDGVRTNVSNALDFVRDDLRDANFSGVLLISDGRYNTGRNPLYVAERYPVPIYTVAVGDTVQRRDLLVSRTTTNDLAYVDATLPIQVGLRSDGYPGEQVSVSVSQGGAVIQNRQVTLAADAGETTVELEYTPRQAGLQRLTVAVTRLVGEATYQNNTASVTVRVLENKKRILLLADAPGPDVAALRGLLEADPNSEVTALVPLDRSRFYQGASFPSDWSAYDLLILAGYPGPSASAEQVRQIVAAIDDGLPSLFILGRQTNLQQMASAFENVLPVTPGTIRTGHIEAAFVPAPRSHPILDIDLVEPEWIRRLPPLYYNESRWRVAPDARVLATTRVRGVELDDPLLVIQQRSGRRAAAFLGAEQWRWRNVPEDLQPAAAYWPQLLDNLVQWVSTRQDNRRVRVTPITEVFDGGEPVQLNGQVYDESLNPVSDAAVVVDVTAPDGTHYPYAMDALGNGRYTLAVEGLPAGTYQYTASATSEGEAVGSDEGVFAVGSVTVEFEETQADVALMRLIAQRSGGEAIAPDAMAALPTRLAETGAFTSLILEEAQEIELWQRYLFLTLILLCLTVEWFFRKRSGMV